MNSKYIRLLEYLISRKEKTTAGKLAVVLGVSSRTIKTYIRDINRDMDCEVVSSSRDGYLVNREVVCRLLEMPSVQRGFPQNFEERARYIIKSILIDGENSADIYDISEDIFVGYQTLVNDVYKMNKVYESQGIRFSIVKGQFKIEGSEEMKRELISRVIREEAGDSELNLDLLADIFIDFDVHGFSDAIRRIYKESGYFLNDFNFVNLLQQILIMVKRSDYPVTEDMTKIASINKSFVNEVINCIEECLDTKVTEYTREQLELLISCNSIFPDQIDDFKPDDEIDKTMVEITGMIIRSIDEDYYVNLNSDIFKLPFTLHLSILHQRVTGNITVSNPMADIIRKTCPIIYDMAVRASDIIKQSWGFPLNMDETSFLALHIGGEIERQKTEEEKLTVILVCQDYHGLREWLYHEVMKNFGNRVHVKAIVSSIEDTPDHQAIILAVNPQTRTKRYQNMVLIDPYHSIPCREICDVLDRVGIQKKILFMINNFDKIFSEKLFMVLGQEDKWSVIENMSKILFQEGYVSTHFQDNVNIRERAASTAFEFIAIPHSMKHDAYKTAVCIGVSQEGIRWDEQLVHLVFLFCVNKSDAHYFKEIFEAILILFDDEKTISKLSNCCSFEQFKKGCTTFHR